MPKKYLDLTEFQPQEYYFGPKGEIMTVIGNNYNTSTQMKVHYPKNNIFNSYF